MLPPKRVVKNHFLVGLIGHFRLGERVSHGQRHAESREKFGRHASTVDALGRAGLPDYRCGVIDGGYLRKSRNVSSPLVVTGQRSQIAIKAGLRSVTVSDYQLIVLGKRQ